MRTVDLSQTSLRELNAALHRLRAGHQRDALARAQSARPTRHRCRHRRADHGRDRGPCRLLLRRHEQGGDTIVLNGNAGQGVAENMMSGLVHVKGDAIASGWRDRLRRPPRRRRQCLGALRHLDEGHRHRRQRIGRTYVRLHGAGRQPRRARRCRRGARRFDLRGAAVRSRQASKASAPIASRRRWRRAPARPSCAKLLEAAGMNGSSRSRRVPPLRLGAEALSFPYRQCGGVLMEPAETAGSHTPPRMSATFDEFALAEIRRAAATGIYDIRGFGAKRKLPHFDDLAVSRRLGQSLSARRLSREMRHRRDARHALREEADQAEDPDHHRGHELRLALGARQGSARARRDDRWAPRPRPATAA